MAPKSRNESAKQSEFNSFLKKSDDDESSDPLSSSSHPSFSRPPNPYPESSFLSKMFFIWPQQLLKEGSLKPIEEKDLPTIMKKEESRHNREIFETIWQNEIDRVESAKKRLPEGSKKRENLRPSLGRALTIDFLKSTWIIQPCMFASSCARVSMSVALGYLIQTFIDKSKDGYYWAIVVIVSNAIVLFEHHHVFFITWRKGMQYRIGAVSSVFSKSLRLNSVARDDSTSVGQTMNLVSNDVERFLLTTLFASYIFWAPIQAIIIIAVGTYMTGPAFALGVGLLLFFFIPVQLYLSKGFASLRSKVAAITDERMILVSQAIEGVRVMKMSGWENELQKRVLSVRSREVKQIHKANRLKAVNEVVFFVTYVVVTVVIFMVHVFVFDSVLITRDVFTTLSLIGVMQLELMKHLSLGVAASSECTVSVRRIQKYFEAPELVVKDTPVQSSSEDVVHDLNELVSLNSVTCHWDNVQAQTEEVEQDRTVALDNITFSLRKNELTFIVGTVGSGKSALLYALAGEILPSKGDIKRSHTSLAYAAQSPWIMNGTVRSNIVMGAAYDPVFYSEVVEACGLSHDFKQFSSGDDTIVGDRGVQCSGGQKARIGLARALYLNADIVLLDDPLSAVDSKVGRHIFYSAVQNLAVKRGKCVVLATHQHQYIGDTRCIHMSGGTLRTLGSFEDCVKNSGGDLHPVSHNAEELEDGPVIKKSESSKPEDSYKSVRLAESIEEKAEEKDQIETKFTGVVSKGTFVHYAKSMGSVWLSVSLFIVFLIAQTMQLSTVIILGRWSEFDTKDQRSMRIVGAVLGLCGALVCMAFLQTLSTFRATVRASKRLHNAMVAAVFRAKIEFFDTNPSGRILNRFSGDVGSNDDQLPSTLFDFTICAVHVSGAMITAIVALPFILVIMPPLLWYFVNVRRLFVNTSRELKRLEGLARSPIFAMLSESLSGVSTIRPNNVEKYILQKFEACHDAHSRAFWSFLASSRWLGFRMDFLMFINCSIACVLAVLFNEQGWFGVDPVIFGLALSLLIQLGSIFQWTIRQSAEVVNLMVCVERVSEYSKIEPEAALTCESDDDNDKGGIAWPVSGSIEVRDLSIRYRDSLPLSLDSVSFSVPSGKRLGVVGRTGSGKSTLVQALFRLLEPETGQILIDGVDIQQLGLHKLRKGLSVINQTPVLFSGCTVRENLDPFRFYSDDMIIDALTDVQMIDAINSLPLGINSQVAESGLNFSVGERQLLCLARAMLQKSRVLVLDEPTANVDGRTDKLLQKAVDKSFLGSTIISVAHRLDTIIENDLILVLGDGKVIEFGSPSELLSLDGHFTSMVNDTGTEMSIALKRRAQRCNQ